MKFPILSDFRDRRAKTQKDKATWLEVVGVSGSALLGCVAPLIPPITQLLEQIKGAAVFIRCGLAVVVLGVVLEVIAARKKEKPAAGIRVHDDDDEYVYVHSKSIRLLAKVIVVPLSALCIYRVWEITPNAIAHRALVSGYLCMTSDKALGEAAVVLRSETGNSVGRTSTGSDGYFVADVERWGLRPLTLEYSGDSCAGNATVADGSTSRGCPKTPPDGDHREATIWRVSCK